MPSRRNVVKMVLALPLLALSPGSMQASRQKPLAQSDHFDGRRFFNPTGGGPRGFGDVLRWKLDGGKAEWPSRNPSPFPQDKPPVRVSRGLRIVLVGHSSFLVQGAGLNILLDPVWSSRASPLPFAGPRRRNAPGIAFEDLPPIDAVLVSHNHYDHLDQPTLHQIHARDKPLFIAPLRNEAALKGSLLAMNIRAADWNDEIALSLRAGITVLRAQHWSARGVTDRNRALWSAYALRLGGRSVYFAGDTAFADGSHFAEAVDAGPFDVALLPIGAYAPRWFMKGQHINPEEAVRAFNLLNARTAIGCHWGTFQLTDEGVDQPALDLSAALKTHGITPERFVAARPGQVFEIA